MTLRYCQKCLEIAKIIRYSSKIPLVDVASVVTLGSASSSLPELELEPEPELLDPEPEPDELELEPESEDFFGFELAAAWASLLLAVLTTSGRG